MDWRGRFDLELANAKRARSRGNEAQARVCARRAAGIAGAEYLRRRGVHSRSRSAMDVLQQLREANGTPPSTRSALHNLLLQVSQDFKLPPGIDLIADAGLLRDELLPQPDPTE